MIPGKVRRGVSVLVVTHDSAATLPPVLDALRRSTGPQDEVICVDAGSTDGSVDLLRRFEEEQPETRRMIVQEGGSGHAAAVNAGLRCADRPYVALVHADVVPAEGWLDRLLATLLADPRRVGVGWVGSLPAGEARAVEQLRGPCRLFVRAALLEAGGLDESFAFGGEDRDLSLRLVQRGGCLAECGFDLEVVEPAPRSAADSLRRRYLRLQGEQAFADSLREFAPEQRARLIAADEYAPDDGLVSIVIPVMDNLDLTRRCVEALYAHTMHAFELILVDNASREDVRGFAGRLAALHRDVVYLRNERNEGFGHACNQGLAAARGDYLCVLNNDVLVTPGWLVRLLALLRLDPKIALVGPMTNRASGPQVVAEARYDGLAGHEEFARGLARSRAGRFALLTRVVGLCVLMRRAVLDEVGGFDPCFWYGNFEDDDLCLRIARRGWLCAMAEDAFVHHEGSATWKEAKIDHGRLMRDNWRWFCHKWSHTGTLGKPYPARELALARPFCRELDYVPVDPSAALSPDAPPLALDGAHARRLLLFAEPEERAWQPHLAEYLARFGAQDHVTLVLRIEPPTPGVVEAVTRDIERIVRACGRAEADLPDVLLETSRIEPLARGGLYTAATALLAAGGFRDGLHRREATACGLPVGEDVAVALEACAASGVAARA